MCFHFPPYTPIVTTDLNRGEAEKFTKNLVSALSQHPKAKGKTVSSYECPFWHLASTPDNSLM